MTLSQIFESELNDDLEVVDTPEVEEEDMEGVEATEESLFDIATESVRDFCNLRVASIMSDLSIATTYVTEGASMARIELEGAIGGFFAGLKEKIIALWKKVKAWFLKMIENIKVFFSSPAKFIEQYADTIKKKSSTGFEIDCYPMKKDGWNKVKAKAEKVAALVKELSNNDSADKKPTYTVGNKNNDVNDDNGEDISLNVLGHNDIEDMNESLDEDYGIDDKEKIEAFKSGLSKTDMIDKIKGFKKLESEIKNAESKSDREFKTLIKEIEKTEKDLTKPITDDKIDDEAKKRDSEKVDNVRKRIELAKEAIIFKNKLYAAAISREKTVMSECVRVLKAFMYFRPEKVVNNSFMPNFESSSFGNFRMI